MNERVVKNPNFKNNGEFHASLAARGVGAKDWPNTHTEVEHLGNGKFGASIGVGHRVFFDKADKKAKKHKLTDERPSKDYVLIQSAKCCVEVHPYYAKYFDVQHEEVRLYEERWVVQRLFKAPDDWRDVGAYNPLMAVEEYSEPAGDVVKVTVTYDTDYGTLTVEYFQRDGNNLKHNVTFTNTSGSTETFRVLQRWNGIIANKVLIDGVESELNKKQTGFHLSFKSKDNSTKLVENLTSVAEGELTDFLEMITGSPMLTTGRKVIFDEDGIRFIVQGSSASLWIDNQLVMVIDKSELFRMVRATKICPDNAKVFIGGLGLGFILFILAHTRKAKEIIVSEIDQRVIDKFASTISEWFAKHYPEVNLRIIHSDARIEVTRHGLLDWIFMDVLYKRNDRGISESTYKSEGDLMNLSIPNLAVLGQYTYYYQFNLEQSSNETLRFKPITVSAESRGLKTDFIYEHWVLAQNETLRIDPDTASLDNPTEDGYTEKRNGNEAGCHAAAASRINNQNSVSFGGNQESRGAVWVGFRGYVEWDISSLAGATLDANPVFKYEGFYTDASEGEINPITEEQPSDGGCSDAELWGYIASGTAYVDPFTVVFGANQSQDLGASAKTDLQTAMTAEQSWFALGFQSPGDECGMGLWSSVYSEEKTDAPTPKPTLYVEYTPAPEVGIENKSANMGAKMVAAGLI